jgi:hypothetical protein
MRVVFCEHNKEGGSIVVIQDTMPKGNSIVSSHSFVVNFIIEPKRAEHRPHLLDRFYLVLGFLGQIFCSFVWMVCILCSFFHFNISVIS